MFLLCFFINCIKLIKETAVSACVFGYHRKKQARNLCLRDAVLTGGLLVLGTFIETEFLHENAIVLIPIINGVAFYIWKRQSIRESIKAYVLSYMIVEVVDSILYVCIALLANVSVNDLGFSDPIMDGICSLPGLFLWALIYKLQKKKSDVWTLVNRNFWVLFAGGILAAVQVSFLTYIVGDGEIRNVAGETYVVLMMLFGSAVIVCAYLIYIGKLKKRSDRQAEQKRIFELEQKLTRDYYVQLYEKNEKTRARQHEFRHMMQTVQDLLKKGEITRATAMVDSWNHMEAEPSTCIYSQNRIVDAVISGVLGAVILRERIQFTYQGRLPQELGVEDLDLCFLLSNILENAKEAVEKIPLDMGERKIHLTIGTYKNLVFLDCINTILPEEELSAETDKDSEWHGFGIHNIHKIVQKYDGEFELSMEKNTAAAHAALHKNL